MHVYVIDGFQHSLPPHTQLTGCGRDGGEADGQKPEERKEMREVGRGERGREDGRQGVGEYVGLRLGDSRRRRVRWVI